ncbi:Predicted arabinose efflux permease, MFS family [Raineyella antarctica]|uniref:Predicted arabinose efflux permease, MFS family n=1 Tax=Raineyella antarctica TaxID=1577474 RepID=A0A1G6GGE7_9ACTN|nr:MFS transporter [Raineyella antarctica]SDB81030.1 Predicted arabinose efflux permease, MFS family [Raineyella antarctica]
MSLPKTSIRPTAADHEPQGAHAPRRAAASGWIGSALEYYDFFIYAQAAALIFPQLFFPKGDPQVALVASLATYGVGYVARPIGAFFLGRWGDTHGRKNVLVLCMLMMGLSTLAVAFLPTYAQVGVLAPALLVLLRLVQGFAVAGELSGASSMIVEHAPFGRRGYFASFTLQGTQFGQILAAAIFIPMARLLPDQAFTSWGWRVPFVLSVVVVVAGWLIRRRVPETPAFKEETETAAVPENPIVVAFRESGGNMIRVMLMALMNVIPTVTTIFGAAYATQAAYGIGFHKDVYLWIPVVGNIVAVVVIPWVGTLGDRFGRRIPIVVGAVGSGVMSFGYLWAISQHSVTLAIVFSIVMWGLVYQGYNATFPSFFAELFPTRTRVTSMAIAQNIGTMLTAFLPAIFALVAPPGSIGIPMRIGAITLAITVVCALAALSARETYRLHVHDLGERDGVPIPRPEYLRLRREAGGSQLG